MAAIVAIIIILLICGMIRRCNIRKRRSVTPVRVVKVTTRRR